MSTASASAALAPARATSSARPLSQTTRALRYARSATAVTLRDGAFVFFTVALPVVMFLMFNAIYGKSSGGTAGVTIMTNMAAYGSLGGALNAGATIQTERANGWLRQLTVAGLNPRGFVFGKIVAALVIMLPALVAVFVVGMTVGGVDIPLASAVVGVLVLWAAIVPMIVLGLALGLVLPPRAVQGASTIVLMALSIAGGLWFPYEFFPDWLKTIAHGTPTYWVGQLGHWATLGGDFPGQAVVVLAVWALALMAVVALLFRRAARSSRR